MRFDHPIRTTLLALLAAATCATPTIAENATALAAGAVPSGGTAGGSRAPNGSTGQTKVAGSGIATWFGPGFYGQKTACGQTLTPAVIGVANRTLPCGTLVKVTYHGRTATVPVLDRGPYAHNGASWDLTAGAAGVLNVEGIARVGTRVVGSVPNTPTLGSPPITPAEALSGGAQAVQPG